MIILRNDDDDIFIRYCKLRYSGKRGRKRVVATSDDDVTDA